MANQVLTVNNDNPLVRNPYAPGAAGQQGFWVESLKQEKSVNYGVGLTGKAGGFTLTADAYLIDIKDRIVLSSQFTRTNPTVAAILGARDISRVQFFANAVNTRTKGLDIVLNERLPLGDKSRLVLTATANFNQTQVTNFNSSSATVNND